MSNTSFKLPLTIDSKFKPVIQSNVAIAAAVTSYARIHMIQYKNSDNCFYTDTDSIFTNKPLDVNLIGNELGQMKDEMNGLIISKGLFLGIKKYGYQYMNNENKLIDKSVISGVERDSITFNEIVDIFKGKVLSFKTKDRFHKSLSDLSINISSNSTTIRFDNSKQLINNNYIY